MKSGHVGPCISEIPHFPKKDVGGTNWSDQILTCLADYAILLTL